MTSSHNHLSAQGDQQRLGQLDRVEPQTPKQDNGTSQTRWKVRRFMLGGSPSELHRREGKTRDLENLAKNSWAKTRCPCTFERPAYCRKDKAALGGL